MRISLLILVLTLFIFSCSGQENPQNQPTQSNLNSKIVKLFLAGDVMTGRGIDQIFTTSNDPVIYEPYVKSADTYVALAENENGTIQKPVAHEYIWGYANEIWKEEKPDLKIINLETSITTNDEYWPGKGIQYRMHPDNTKTLVEAEIDAVSLANNHVLDWQRAGLRETLESLKAHNIKYVGAGKNHKEASSPLIIKRNAGRVIVLAYATKSSGVPPTWAATANKAGIHFLSSFDQTAVQMIKKQVNEFKKQNDIIILSIHWGGNWGYDIPTKHRKFAQSLIDEADVDIIHGHSSHHPKGIEIYKDKLIIYGAGDFINDYEGISGHEQYNPEITLMYFPEIDTESCDLTALKMVPVKINKLQLQQPSSREKEWIFNKVKKASKKLDTHLAEEHDILHWKQ